MVWTVLSVYAHFPEKATVLKEMWHFSDMHELEYEA
jgi:hypothetical protein